MNNMKIWKNITKKSKQKSMNIFFNKSLFFAASANAKKW